MAVFAVLGALDRIFGNKFGLGKEFENGITAMGSLALAMIGIICLAPVLSGLLKPGVVPVFSFLGADPAMFAAVTGYGDHAINYVVRVWCPSDKYWDVFNATTYNIKVIFDREGIEMTYPHLNVHLEK